MKLLLGSGGYRSDERREALVAEMRRHFGEIERILFVPYAGGDYDRYVSVMTERGFNAGYVLDGIHGHEDPVAAVREAQGIYVGGGNTFRLVDALHRHGLLEPIRARVAEGMPYMGVSAGSNVACPTLKTSNDMPIVQPPSFEALGLVTFQINPHYYAGNIHYRVGDEYEEHFGETRDQRISEFHELNEVPVVGLYEGAALRVEDGQVTLLDGPARVFRRGQDPVDLAAGARVDELFGADAARAGS